MFIKNSIFIEQKQNFNKFYAVYRKNYHEK